VRFFLSSDIRQSVEGGDSQNAFYRWLCECSNYAIIATDCQGIIIGWNRAAELLFSAESAKMTGCHIERVVPESRRELLRTAIERAITQKQISEFEISHSKAEQGDSQSLLMSITPVMDQNEQILGLSMWVLDITNRKHLQNQLIQAEKMASLGTLASGVAHHFNNIIGGVATFVDYALGGDNPQADRRALQMTAEAAERISNITSSLLTFAEKDIRQFDLSDMTEVIMTFSQLVEKSLAEKDIKLELHLQAVPIYEVPGSRIHQVLGNLLDNAEFVMPDGGTVTIGLRSEGDNLVMSFSDTGSGIGTNDLPHVFDPFFTTKGVMAGGSHRGSGLGLSVVHGIISELGGQASAESEPGKGTTFTIRLPIHRNSTT